MTVKKTIFVLLSLLSFNLNAQSIKIILDSITKEPLAYSTILYYKDGKVTKGSYTDVNGAFQYEKTIKTDSIKISNIGYVSKIISSKNTLLDKMFFLIPKKESLDEIILSSVKPEDLGYIDKKANGQSLGLGLNGNTGIYINNKFDDLKIVNSIKFQVSKVYDPMMIRAKLYDVDTIHNRIYPGSILNQKDYRIKIEKKSKESFEIKLNENIQFPKNGLFVILEGLSYSDGSSLRNGKKTGIRLAATKSDDNIYYYKVNHSSEFWLDYNRWAIEDYKISFGREIPRKWLSVPLIGITVVDY